MHFDLAFLGDLPQRRRLALVLDELWQEPSVLALWIGGSLARGVGDRYSDVDLRVAVPPEAFAPEQILQMTPTLYKARVGHISMNFGSASTLLHMLLEDGEIYDFLVQSIAQEPTNEVRQVLACRDEAFAAKLLGGEDPVSLGHSNPAEGEALLRVIEFFWLNQQKGQKVLFRGMPLMMWVGENLMRQDLIRLWYVVATGNDCGPLNRLTIHTLTPVIRAVQDLRGAAALALVGRPLRTVAEFYEHMTALQDEMAQVGRQLAERHGFVYPTAAEATVRATWQHFRQTHKTEKA